MSRPGSPAGPPGRRRRALLRGGLILGLALLGPAAPAAAPEPGEEARGGPPDAPPEDIRSVTEHTLVVNGREIAYTATADAFTVDDADGTPRAWIFHVAYATRGEDGASRPVTFVFNGGPGAASAYLHLGALGPRRVRLSAEGLAALPLELEDNPTTWLPFTDLVFVDPPGTGYSRVLGADEGEKEDGAGPDGEGGWSPWGVEEDAEVLAAFIRRWLTQEDRWASPVYLAGESYGGFRAALLAGRLPAEEGIAPRGLVLISPVLDFGLVWGDAPALLPSAARLPSYAAVAAFHGRGAVEAPPEADPRAALAGVEGFALNELLTGLAAGSGLSEDARSELYRRIAEYSGLSFEEVKRRHGRVPAHRFAALLLEGRNRTLSLYDGSLVLIDPNTRDPDARDILLDRLGTALVAGFHVHARTALGLDLDLPYRLLSAQVFEDWDWTSGVGAPQGFSGVQGHLRRALSLNPALQVLVVHGVYDLVTPYFASAIVLRQLAVDPEVAENLTLSVYPGGHMAYTHPTARAALHRDAARLYPQAEPPAPAPAPAAESPQPEVQ